MFGKKPTAEDAPAAAATVKKGRGAPAQAAGDDNAGDQLWSPAAATRVRKSVEQLLLERGEITEEQLAQAKSVQAQTPGKAIPQILLTMNAASEAQVLKAFAETLGLP